MPDKQYVVTVAVDGDLNGIQLTVPGIYFSVEDKTKNGFWIAIRNVATGGLVEPRREGTSFNWIATPIQ
ncbi:MAG: hypothetical protein ACT4QA_00705 [Panacagrimonas sp.]